MRIVVAGGGIAGLAVATRAGRAHDVLVLERESHGGGKVRTEHVDGYTFEWGPNGFLSGAAELQALVDAAGLRDAVVQAAPAASQRYVYWNGRLRAVPAKPPHALTTPLLSPLGKLRALGDLVLRTRARSDGARARGVGDEDESVHAFAARRFGREVADRIVAPALLGVSGGDAATTSIEALFPRIAAAERAHGSVIRGMMRARRAGNGGPGKLSAFGAAGMQQLTDALAARLDVRFRANATVAALEPRAGGGWHVVYDSVDGARDRAGVYADRADAALGNGAIDADAVVLAMPSYAAADLVAPFDGDLASSLRAIPYATMRVAGVAYRSRDVPAPLDGFGFLAARGAGLRILGALFTSTIFPDQAPPDTAYFRVFLGGAVDPNVLELDEAALRDVVRNDLRTALGITAEPVAFHERTWVRAIPQYGLRHRALLASIDERVRAHPGLALAGNAYRGLGLGDVVRDAFAVADGLAPRDPASA